MKKQLFVAVAVVALFVANAAGAATKQVAIVHVQKGCHVWSVGAKQTPSLSLTLHRGDRLAVLNHDLDMHKLVQVSGPATNAGPFMMMHQRVVIPLMKPGVYQFHTKVADMRGMPTAETIGPDNKLLLTVHVT